MIILLFVWQNKTLLGSKSKKIGETEANDYYFEPTFLQGRPGQKLTLTIENESRTLHNFSIPEQQLDKDIPPRSKVTMEVMVPQSGTAFFFCKFHGPLGMKGNLLTGDATLMKPQLVGSLTEIP